MARGKQDSRLDAPKGLRTTVIPRRGSVETRELPAKKEIERLAHAVIDSFSQAPQRAKAAALDRAFSQLGRAVLGPVAGALGKDRLLIVADGALQRVPFAALPVPSPLGGIERPLLFDHEIVNLPSASRSTRP